MRQKPATLTTSTKIKIVTSEDISGQRVVEGDPLTFKVAKRRKMAAPRVIAKDSNDQSERFRPPREKRFYGRKGGELSELHRIKSTTLTVKKVKLRASKSGAGGDNMSDGRPILFDCLFAAQRQLGLQNQSRNDSGSAYTDEA